jgi:serine/threonine protein kinase
VCEEPSSVHTDPTGANVAGKPPAPPPALPGGIKSIVPKAPGRPALVAAPKARPTPSRTAIPQLIPGSEVERYVIEARLGAGRMSTTYRARHTILDTLHALTLPNEPNKSLHRWLINGAKTQASLHHGTVVGVTDVVDHGGIPGIVFENIDGPTLEDFIASHDLDEKGVDAIAGGIIDAIAWLHRNGVVHRNLKPRNVVIDLGGENATPRITDFTLAKVMGKSTRRKKAKVFGTASYMSPEQTFDSNGVDTRSDIWALGALLYLVATKHPAFPDGEDVFERVRECRYKPLLHQLPNAPLRWMDAIDAALTVDLDERVPTAEELSDLWFADVTSVSQMSSRIAPVGQVTLVFTDVQGSTRIWENNPETARFSLKAHDAVMRTSIGRHGGYEVKTEGDAFMVAFPHPAQALDFCLDVQRNLHEHPWSDDLLALPEASEEGAFRGMRVRMGIHTGEPEVRPHNNMVDYFGPMVNRAARIAHAGHGGQVLISRESWNLLQAKNTQPVVEASLGRFLLRGLSGTQEILQVLPADLADRTFPPVRAEPAG